MRKLIVSSFAAALLTAPFAAHAADIAPIYKARAPAASYGWTGLYAGVNAGYSVARDPGTFTAFVNPVIGLDNDESYKLSPAGFLAGAQLGYNWQSGNWVVGLETDFQGTGQRDTVCMLSCLVDGTVSGTVRQKLPWFGTVRGRLGVAADRALLYLTGGLAYGKVETSVTEVNGAANITTASASSIRAGWVVGGGIEAAVAGNWTAKVEYLYIDLRPQTLFFLDAGGPPGTVTVTTSMRDHVIRGGVNYRFGEPVMAVAMPVKARYAAAPSYSWAGSYLGVNAGYGVARDPITYFNNTTGHNTSFKISPAGGLGGGQIGYNWQAARWVAGLEADIQTAAMKDTVCTFGCIANAFFNLFGIVEQRLPWFGTVRGRFGYAADGALFYVTGGLAYGKVETNVTHIQGAAGTVTASASNTKTGATFGAGVEASLTGNWSAKLEYLHINFGSQTLLFAFPPPLAAITASSVATDIRENVFRAGLNYRFDWGPVIAKY
jgi:outer membrane immunogenic protein